MPDPITSHSRGDARGHIYDLRHLGIGVAGSAIGSGALCLPISACVVQPALVGSAYVAPTGCAWSAPHPLLVCS